MKKITSVLLAMAMLASMLCTTALAVDAGAYVEAHTSVNSSDRILTVEFTAAQATTNGKITVEYDAGSLTYSDCSVNGTAASVSQQTGTVTFGYGTSTLDAIQPNGSVAVLTFYVSPNAQGTTYLHVSVEEFNQELGLDASLPLIQVDFETPAVPDIPAPVVPAPGDGSTKPGPGTTTPKPDKDPDTTQEPEPSQEPEPDGEPDTQPGPDVTEPPATVDPAEVYTDVSKTQWFYPAVSYVVGQGYFRGTSANEFEPDSPMTRAMFVTVLGRIEGIDENADVSTVFSDVPSGAWYTAAVAWASEAKVVMGVSANLFDPNGNVTREQMAVFLYRYAQYLGMDVSFDASLVNQFADGANVSNWASDAMAWAIGCGIISGTEKGLEPQAQATRAQVAQIIFNFSNLLG